MDAVEVALVLVFVVVAVADWVAIGRGDRAQRPLTKTAATVMLVAVAARAGEMAGDARTALVVAVVACLAGDVALLGDTDRRFLGGLVSFAVGHVAYTVTALLAGVDWPRLAVALPFLAVVVGVQVATRMIPGARPHGGTPMMIGVVVYSVIIGAMVVTATGTSSWAAAVGAMLFATSDSIIGYIRFVRPVGGADLPVMVTYHTGQLLLILGLIAAA